MNLLWSRPLTQLDHLPGLCRFLGSCFDSCLLFLYLCSLLTAFKVNIESTPIPFGPVSATSTFRPSKLNYFPRFPAHFRRHWLLYLVHHHPPRKFSLPFQIIFPAHLVLVLRSSSLAPSLKKQATEPKYLTCLLNLQLWFQIYRLQYLPAPPSDATGITASRHQLSAPQGHLQKMH